MRRSAYFDTYWGDGWPDLDWLGSYFLTPEGRRKFFSDNDSWGLSAYGMDGTENLERGCGRIDIDLTIQGHPKLGVLLYYHRYGDGSHETRYSKGDLSRLREWVRTMHDDLMPVGLFIPFELAWTAVRQFIETDARAAEMHSLVGGSRIACRLVSGTVGERAGRRWMRNPQARLICRIRRRRLVVNGSIGALFSHVRRAGAFLRRRQRQ